MQITALFMH